MYDPDGDLSAVWAKLANDSTLLTLLGWTTGKLKTDFVWKSNKPPTSPGTTSKICLYFVPSRSSPNPLTSQEVIQIDVHSPSTKPQDGYKIQARIKALLHLKTVNDREFWWAGQLGDLTTATGYSCLGVRYRYAIVV